MSIIMGIIAIWFAISLIAAGAWCEGCTYVVRMNHSPIVMQGRAANDEQMAEELARDSVNFRRYIEEAKKHG